MFSRFIKVLPALALAVPLAACFEEGPAERAGRQVDRAAENLRDTVDPPKGPVERLGRAVDRATN
ncbi:hypothetical protein IAI18_04145 [Acetobacteraceae bacterium H6797]|nr:hypothetical protein [Acetobacteraceae bacterium H6797]